MDQCAVCGEAITELNIFTVVPQTIEDDLFFCNGPECTKVAAIFMKIEGIQERADQIRTERDETDNKSKIDQPGNTPELYNQ